MVEARRLWEERARGRRAETREKHLEDVAGSLVDRQPALRSLLPELRSVLLSMAPGYCYEKGGKEGLLLFPGRDVKLGRVITNSKLNSWELLKRREKGTRDKKRQED